MAKKQGPRSGHYTDRIRKFYEGFLKFPATSNHATGWAERGDQILRMITMAGMIKFNGPDEEGNLGTTSVLDVGCGVGDLWMFFNKNRPEGCEIEYTGIDIMPEMIEKGAGLYKGVNLHVSSLMDWRTDILYDWVICSGVFNSPGYENFGNVLEHIRRMYHLSKQGVAFNFLEACSMRDRIDGLCYQDGSRLFAECKKICDRIVLLSDYNIAEADSTILMFNDKFIDDEIDVQLQAEYEQQEELKRKHEMEDDLKYKPGNKPDLKIVPPEPHEPSL